MLCCAEELPWPPAFPLAEAARLALVDGRSAGFSSAAAAAGAAAGAQGDPRLLLMRRWDAAAAWIDGALATAAAAAVAGGRGEDEGGGGGGSSSEDESETEESDAASGNCARGAGVLVHCSEGKSRSVAVVAAFLVARRGLGAAEALAAVRAARPCAAPHPFFLATLEAYAERRGGQLVQGESHAAAAVAVAAIGGKEDKEA